MSRLQPLLDPASVAVIGASEKGAGRHVLRNLKELGYPGDVYPVNPKYRDLEGWPCYPRVAEIPHPADCAVILTSEKAALEALRDCGRMGIRAAVILASGFAEAGGSGAALQDQLKAVCREYDIRVCGPNCLGVINLHGRVPLYASRIPDTLTPGNVGVIGQSGAVCISFVYNDRGLGLSHLISTGNEAVVQAPDYLEALLECPRTQVIAAFLEEIRNPQKFLELARRAQEAGKPIVVLKVGRSARGKRAASSHTGSLAGNHEVCAAALRQHGVIEVSDLDELVETALLLSRFPAPEKRGEGAGIITASGGEITLLLDLAEEIGLSLPELSPRTQSRLKEILPPYTRPSNPLDTTQVGIRDPGFYKACLEALAQDENLACVAVGQDCPANAERGGMTHFRDLAQAAVEVSGRTGAPMAFFSNTSGPFHPDVSRILREGRLPLLQGSRESLRAVGHLIRWSGRRGEGAPAAGAAPRPAASPLAPLPGLGLVGDGGRMLTFRESQELLRAYGIPLCRGKVCASLAEALQAAEETGYPVAVKAISSAISHKTEAGGVILDVADADGLRRAFQAVQENARRFSPGAVLDGVLVQEMLRGGVEVIVGVSRDEQFGPAIMVGLGGIWVELFRDVAFRLPPLQGEEARAMLREIRGHRLLEGFRGQARKDVDALADVLVRVSRLAEDHGACIAGLDLNPLLVFEEGKGVKAVDFRVELV